MMESHPLLHRAVWTRSAGLQTGCTEGLPALRGFSRPLLKCLIVTPSVRNVSSSSLRQRFSMLAHLCSPLDFVPVEGLPIEGPHARVEEQKGEDLPIREPLQPDVEQQPSIPFVGGVA